MISRTTEYAEEYFPPTTDAWNEEETSLAGGEEELSTTLADGEEGALSPEPESDGTITNPFGAF